MEFLCWGHLLLSLCSVAHALRSWEELEANVTKINVDLPPWTKTGNKTTVSTRMIITHFKLLTISEIEISFHLIQRWRDIRLEYDSTSIAGKYVLLDLDKYVYIWTPDSYVSNAVSEIQHSVTKPNVFIRVYPNGTLIKSTRLTVTYPCPLKANEFPVGAQGCDLILKSYSYTKSEVDFVWAAHEPHRFGDEYGTNNIEVKDFEHKPCTQIKDEQPCLKLEVTIIRNFTSYILRIYIPSALLVILGWLSMWIDKGQVGARTSLGVLCVLSLVTQIVGVVSMSENLENVLALDVWMAVCVSFTIMALIVFAIVHNIKRRKDKTKSSLKYKEPGESGEGKQTWCTHGRIQNLFRIIYPSLFIIFNIAYWAYFLRDS